MQSLYPLVTADFTAKAHQPVNKLELFIECCAYDLCDFYGKNYLIEAYYSSGQRELSYCPVAAEFTAIIDATDGLLHPKNTDSPFYSYLKVGRKIIFHTGFKKDGIDYLWQWFEGIISDVQINNSANQITIRGFDYTQYLTEVKLKSPDNYWGAVKNTVTVADQADYDLSGLGCNGAYIAYLDGVQIYNGDTWIYDEGTEKFWFLPSSIPVANDIPLIIYYYTTQVPENVVADLLVTAGLYPTQAAALANMDYTATGVDDDIDRVRFNTGVSVLYAIQKICERIDYEFYFKHDGTPVFKPIATVGASSFTFGKELVGTFDYIENIDEVRNHIIIEGEEYSIYDELYRILDGTEIMYTLDDIPDGDPVTGYGRMKMTSITAGKIIIAGCQAEVTNQMFTTPEARNNVEAWKHAGDVTLIDGGNIYTGTVILDKLSTSRSPNLLKSKYSDFQSFEDEGSLGYVGHGTAKCDTADFYIGDRCLRMVATDTDNYVYLALNIDDYNIRLKPSTKYIVSFYAKADAGTPQVRGFIKQDDTTQKIPALQFITTSWVRYKFIIETDAGLTDSGLLGIGNYTDGATVWFDAIQVEEASAAASPEASPYKPSGTVEIHGGQIEAETLLVNRLVVGSDANTEDTLDVYQGEGDTQIFRLRSTSINHQITQGGGLGYDWGTYTDCYAYMRKENAAQGGLFICAFSEATHDIALSLWGIYGDANNLTTGNANGGITLAAVRGNPATHGYQACEVDDNIFVIKTKSFGTDDYQAKLILKQGGYLYIEGTYESFQNEDDIKLVKELEDILSNKIDKKKMKEKDVCKKHKVVNVNEVDGFKHDKDGKLKKTGKKRLDRFVNTQAKDMLLMGAIRQLGEKNQALEERINQLELTQ